MDTIKRKTKKPVNPLDLENVLVRNPSGNVEVLSKVEPRSLKGHSHDENSHQDPTSTRVEEAQRQLNKFLQVEDGPLSDVSVSVVIPTFNEDRTLAKVIDQLSSQQRTSKLEIIVVDDGSTDSTPEILSKLLEKYEFTVLTMDQNSGKGNAVRAGIAKASGTHLLIFDADSEYDPYDIEHLIRPVVTQRADLVFGVRVQGVNTTHPTLLHAVGNRVMTSAANLLYGSSITDMHTCLKLVRLSVLRSLPLTETGFGLDTEITSELLRRGHRPFEVPVSYIGRSRAEGKHIKFKDALRSFYVMARVRLRRNPKTQDSTNCSSHGN